MDAVKIYLFFLSLFLLSLSAPVLAQNTLTFTNTLKGKQILIKPGDLVKFEYNGYLGQPQVIEKSVLQVTETAVVLGQTVFGNVVPQTEWTLLTPDITGFRKFMKGRNALKGGLRLATGVGLAFFYREALSKDKFTTTQSILITFGIGTATSLLIEAMFPKKVKNRIGQGWILEK